MDFKTQLAHFAAKIDREIEEIFRDWEAEVAKTSRRLLPYNQLFREAVFGGKRLRGFLVTLGYQLAGGKVGREILKAAAAIEIFHTALLVQDDVIDKSRLRRGKVALHLAIAGQHEGLSHAIVLADVGIFLAVRTLSTLRLPAQRKIMALENFFQTSLKTALGQELDVVLAKGGKRSQEEVLQMTTLKTAWYTVVGPLQVGAILGGGSAALLKKLERFGMALGLAFQIRDDILGVFGREKELGKSVTSDVEENKNTVLITYALAHTNGQQRAFLSKVYGKRKITAADFAAVKRLFRESGALTYAQKRAEELAAEAKKEMPALEKLADFMVQRTK